MSFSKRSDNTPICYTKPLDSLKNWNDHFFWVDTFACPVLFPWHTAKNVTRDPAPFPEEFLCLVGLSHHYTLDEETYPRFLDKNGEGGYMYIFAFIHTPDPTKVKVVERERIEDEPLLLETTVGRTVPLLPVAPDHTESKLEASVDKLFDEGGSGNQTKQGDSTGGGQAANIQLISGVVDTAVEDVAPVLSEDHETPSGAFVGGKSMSSVQRLLAGAMLNAEVRGRAIPTLPFVTSSVSATPEREGGDHTDSVAEPNLRTVSAPQRFIISSDSSHHSGANVAEAEVDSLVRSSVPFAGSSSAGGTDPTMGDFTDLTGNDFLVGGIRTVINPESDLHKTYVPQWSMTNGSRLNDGRVFREMVDEFAPPKFFASVRRMEHDQLFTEFNVGAARQMSLSAEVRMRAEYNVKERSVEKKDELLKARDE
ncbi:hypothetical protein Tco_0714886 [Tanacetum coccineum]